MAFERHSDASFACLINLARPVRQARRGGIVNRDDLDSLLRGLKQRSTPAVARLISWAEDRDPRMVEVLSRVFADTGEAHRIGITGPPGAGKSTLIARVVEKFRAHEERVAVVAVDPSSPFSGGALLGDRVRMPDVAEDHDVFLRSMATRGSLGGLASATEDVLDLLDAAGYRRLIAETVGVGQVELDIAMATDTVVVVLVPESGDGIQAMKAGLMEIADVFVVNKADREGAQRLAGEIESMLDIRGAGAGWRPPVLQTTALRGDGVEDLMDAMERHRSNVNGGGARDGHRRDATRERVIRAVREELLNRAEKDAGPLLEDLLDKVARRETAPAEAARILAAELLDRD